MCIAVAILSLISNWAFAQFQPVLFSTNSSWRTQANPQVGRIGIGNFPNFTNLPSALTINANLIPNPTGEVFRTTSNATGTNVNAWRLFTGAGNGTEKGMIFNYGNNPVAADQTNFSLQASARDMTFHTLPIVSNTVGTERMRIVGETGFVGIGTTEPKSALEVANGDIAVTAIGKGIILKSTNGNNYYRITVDNTGKLNTELIAKL